MKFLKNVAKGALCTAGILGAITTLVAAVILGAGVIHAAGPLAGAALTVFAICLIGGIVFAKVRPLC